MTLNTVIVDPNQNGTNAGMKRSNATEINRRAMFAGNAPNAYGDNDIRIARLGPVPELLRELQCDPVKVLTAAGFDPALFKQPDVRVPYRKVAQMLVTCAESSATPHFGLLLGIRFELAMLGVLDPLVRNSISVRDALTQLIRHLHLNDAGATGFLAEREPGEIAFGYNVYRSDVPGAIHVYAIALSSIYGIMRTLCGPAWQPKRILFAHDMPENIDPYHQFYRVPLQFNATRSEIVFADHWLDLPLHGADSGRRLSAERIALTAEAQQDNHFVNRVRRVIYELLMAGEVSTPLICARLGIHERVLRRHLHAENTSVKQLIGASRHEIACQLLGNTQLSQAEIATSLCYSDATAFSRAFRSLAGMPPDRWRRHLRAKVTGLSSSIAHRPVDRNPAPGPDHRGTAGQGPGS